MTNNIARCSRKQKKVHKSSGRTQMSKNVKQQTVWRGKNTHTQHKMDHNVSIILVYVFFLLCMFFLTLCGTKDNKNSCLDGMWSREKTHHTTPPHTMRQVIYILKVEKGGERVCPSFGVQCKVSLSLSRNEKWIYLDHNFSLDFTKV